MTERLTLNTELKFDPETQDIFIFLSPEGFKQFVEETQFIRVVDEKKRVAFFITTLDREDPASSEYIKVDPTYRDPEDPAFTSFLIRLSRKALEDLKARRPCGDRYLGFTGAEKIKILIGDPDEVVD